MQRYFSHICDGTDVQADWRSCTYGRALNAIDISQGSLTCPSYTETGPTFLYGDSDTPPHLVAFYDTLGIRRTYSRLKNPASSRGGASWKDNSKPTSVVKLVHGIPTFLSNGPICAWRFYHTKERSGKLLLWNCLSHLLKHIWTDKYRSPAQTEYLLGVWHGWFCFYAFKLWVMRFQN